MEKLTFIAEREMSLDEIRIDGNTQARENIDVAQVTQYSEDMAEGDKFTEIVLVYDGKSYWLADGFHRFHAAQKAGKKKLLAKIARGTLRDAQLYSFTANIKHGMPMSNADKKSSAKKMLEDIEWECWSDRQIGRHVGLSHTTIAAIRASMSTAAPEKVKFIKDGKEYEKKRVPERAIKPAPELKAVAEVTEEPEKHDPKDDAIKFLIEENDKLKDQLAAISGDESETTMTHISELREELKQAKIELAAVIKSRDSYQAENSQLKKQVSYMQRQIKKAA